MSLRESETSEPIVWVDCEMTGLNLDQDATIEVAVVVTDSQLNVLGQGIDVIIKPPAAALAGMIPYVQNMHATSGLLDSLSDGVSLADAENQVMQYVRQWVPAAGKAPLAGNSVSTDRAFLQRDLPEFADYLHYRTIDVSSIKELARRWFPRIYFHAPEKTGGHRALGDILDSIDELRYYRSVLFVPDPGPTSEEAKAAGQLTTATSPRLALETEVGTSADTGAGIGIGDKD